MMTVNYADSTIDNFDLFSFYFGCATNLANDITQIVETCLVTVTGKDKNGKVIKKQSFAFKDEGGLSQQQKKAVLHGFEGLHTAEFHSTASSIATDLILSTYIDTVDYTVYSKPKNSL
jgi:hypothetical protein